jgi:hypothetical protein
MSLIYNSLAQSRLGVALHSDPVAKQASNFFNRSCNPCLHQVRLLLAKKKPSPSSQS